MKSNFSMETIREDGDDKAPVVKRIPLVKDMAN